MAERLKAHDWKSCDGETRSEVRILFSAPQKNAPIAGAFFCGNKTEKRRGFEGGDDCREAVGLRIKSG